MKKKKKKKVSSFARPNSLEIDKAQYTESDDLREVAVY